jgi:hypothetical protein
MCIIPIDPLPISHKCLPDCIVLACDACIWVHETNNSTQLHASSAAHIYFSVGWRVVSLSINWSQIECLNLLSWKTIYKWNCGNMCLFILYISSRWIVCRYSGPAGLRQNYEQTTAELLSESSDDLLVLSAWLPPVVCTASNYTLLMHLSRQSSNFLKRYVIFIPDHIFLFFHFA